MLDPDAYKNMRNEIIEIKEDFLITYNNGKSYL